MTTTTTGVTTVAEALAANVATHAQWVADGTTDPIDPTVTAPVILDDETVTAVPVEVLDVDHFTKCDGCGRSVILLITAHQNCTGTYCDVECFDAYACHRECYA